MKRIQKSRFFMLHREVNQSKLDQLEALHAAYVDYVRVCVELLLSTRTYKLSRSRKQEFFIRATELTSQIEKNARDHAIGIVTGWAKSRYTLKMKPLIKRMKKAKEITNEQAKSFFTVGKYLILTPSNSVPQETINFYWKLFDERAGNKPTIRSSLPMRLSQETAHLMDPDQAILADFWLQISTLKRLKVIQLPLAGNPYSKKASAVGKGILARKTKKGRWRFEALDKKVWSVPEPEDLPEWTRKIGVDVGLNVLAATSNGDLLGGNFKPQFDSLYQKVQPVRANRQRQGLKENSIRLNRLESKLSGMIRTATGTVANQLVRRYPSVIFVIEDLDLNGCKGQKRFAYRALAHSLENKAATVKVNPAYTSQQCPSCGYLNRLNRHGTTFKCRSCGRKAHADVVGGVNLLGRSEDKQIKLDDNHWEVGKFLRERFRTLRNSSLRIPGLSGDEPLPLGQDLTVASTQNLLGSRIDPKLIADMKSVIL